MPDNIDTSAGQPSSAAHPSNPLCDASESAPIATPANPVVCQASGSSGCIQVSCYAPPQITVSGRQFSEYFDETLAALNTWNVPPKLYRHSGELVKVIDHKGRVTMAKVGYDEFLPLLSRAARFYKKGENPIPVPPPPNLVRSVLATFEGPMLTGVVDFPVLRGDGTLLEQPGYDENTALYYGIDPSIGSSGVPTNPTKDEVDASVAFIDELLFDFNFGDAASKANAVALLLTGTVRATIDGCIPMAVINGTNPGTGKSLLASVASLIATGRAADAQSAPSADDEYRKKITSILRAGGTFILWDNVSGTMRSEALAAALTGRTVSDRLLGTNITVTLAQNATWVATGNNISLWTDLARRCYQISLVSDSSEPWLRTGFLHPDLQAWVSQKRPQILRALLVMARAWFAAGCPAPETTLLGSFEDWTRVIGGILGHAGVTGFLANLRKSYQDLDDDGEQWAAFLAALHEHFSSKWFGIADVVVLVTSKSGKVALTLPEELADGPERGLGIRIGKAFRRKKGSKYGPDSLYLSSGKANSHTKLSAWRICIGNEENTNHGLAEAA